MQRQRPLLLGAQVSVAGGIQLAIKRGVELGCTTIQIFTRNNRQWSFDTLSDEEAATFIAAQKNSPIRIVVSHASYLINLGSSDATIRARSLKALYAELIRCHQAKIPYVVLHPGSCADSTQAACTKHIADGLSKALETTPGDVSILLENMAGQGSSIGHTLDQLAAIYEATDHKKRIGFCFDTCHGFAAGYDFRTPTTYKAFWQQFDTILGIEKLCAIHLNDSKKAYSSHVDRHEDIGKGEIGIEAFKLIMQDKKLASIPKIIETPMDTIDDHARNLAILRKLAE